MFHMVRRMGMVAYQYLSRREIVKQLNYCLGIYYAVVSSCARTFPLNSWLKWMLLQQNTVALFLNVHTV